MNVFRDGDGSSSGSAYGSTSIDYEAHYEGHKWFIHKVWTMKSLKRNDLEINLLISKVVLFFDYFL